ncbi:MAG: class I SAM-dependent DNA methyltransferase [Polyangiales bacterium]
MLPFDRSAALYDALYAELDTVAEVEDVLSRLGKKPRSVIDLGCGTGRHAAVLRARGIEVVGVDRSPAMVERARARGVDARVGDLASIRLGRTFDAAVALFHVFAYATTDAELAAFVATARAHLSPGGLLYFDTWNAEAVAAEPPEPREKIVAGVVRRAVPTVRGELVEVAYTYERDGERFDELHVVRPQNPGRIVLVGFRVRAVERGAGYQLSVLAEAV